MKYKTLTALLFSIFLGCAGPKTMMLENVGLVQCYDKDYFYYYIPIGNTGYYLQGVSTSSFDARIKAEVCVGMLYNYYGFSLQNLKFVEEYGKIKFVIEPKEYKKLIEITPIRNFKK